MRTFIAFIAVAVVLSACQEKKYGAFVVAGKIENAPVQKIALQELPFTEEQPVILDSATLKKNGTFELRAMAKEEGLYRLVIESGQQVLLVNDGNNIRVKVDLNNYRHYTVEGSEASSQLHALLEALLAKDSAYYAQRKRIDSIAGGVMTDSLTKLLAASEDIMLKERRKLLTDFIERSKSPAAICYALDLFDPMTPVADKKQLTDAAAARFPSHGGLARYKSLIAMQVQSQKAQYALLNQPAPEISLPTPNGDTVRLSSLRGKYVLVDFWASWCAPCRKENPNVVAAYKKFSSKNFTILGVSLDKDKTNWVDAIQKDSLSWQHVSDLRYWSSPVVNQYRFDGIPFNVLIDPSGKIIASELTGQRLEMKLSEVLK